MQMMNADQSTHYTNMPGGNTYYPFAGVDQQYSIGNSNQYPPSRMSGSYFNGQMGTPYMAQQIFYPETYAHNAPYNPPSGPRAMVSPSYPPVIRPNNEVGNGPTSYISQGNYSGYPQNPQFYGQRTYPHAHGYQTTPQIANASSMSYQNSQTVMQSSQVSQSLSLDSQHGASSPNPQETVKREKRPLAIVDPKSNQKVDVQPIGSSTNSSSINSTKLSTDSSIHSVTSNSLSEKKNIEFRQQFAEGLKSRAAHDTPSTEPSTEQSTIKENLINDVQTSSTSSSRSGSITKQPEPISSDISIENPIEDKPNDESQRQIEPVSSESQSTLKKSSSSESIENNPPTIASDPDDESIILGKSSSKSKRFGYTIEELRRKRLSLLSQERPDQLREIAGVTTPAIPKQNPKKTERDGDQQYIRDVTAILNKLTPSNYEKLVQQLEKLEMNNAERITGFIKVMFTKAVETAIFCPIYAELCKHFQKRQVTVPNESGQSQTYIFRQLLLTRCQKEFEGEYRQEIEYEKRQAEVDAISDEKTQKEAAEQLQEDLSKAKRKKLGNITFIGELFKLDMLIDTIMYDCVEYLLRDKTDEESLECLCRLLRVIGAKLDVKANEKLITRKKMEKNYEELCNIVGQRQVSARIRFAVQDVLDMKKAGWVARRAEVKPTTIDEIHEEARLKREKEEFDREREKQQRREQNRGGPPLYGESRGSRGSGSRGSGIRQQSSRMDDDRNDNRVIVDSLRQYQSNEKRNQGQLSLNLAPQRAWGKGSGVEKKPEDDRSNVARISGKPPAGFNSSYRTKTGTSTPSYPTQRQSSHELPRENTSDPLRRIPSTGGTSNPNNASSRGSSRTVSPDSNVNERISSSTITSTADNNVNTTFDEEKTEIRVHALIEEYTENYSDNNNRPVIDAIEDLSTFCSSNVNHQAIIVRELVTKVLDAKPRERKAVGHLLDAVLSKEILSNDGFLSGIKLVIEVVPDYAVDIPLIWQYIAEIFGAFIGAPTSNMILLKPILQSIPETKNKQLFKDILRYAMEFSSQDQIQKFWQSAGLSLNELVSADSSLLTEYAWLNDSIVSESLNSINDNLTPCADPQLVKLFKAINDKEITVNDEQILTYIQENMNSTDKYYIRNIVLSYLEACLINRDSLKKIQEDIAKKRTTVLNKILANQPENQMQAVYAIQNFVHKLEHPSKMAQLLFDIFYDEECVTEEVFFQWLNQPDPSEMEGHSVVEMSTKDFFQWLQQPSSDNDEGDEN